MPIRVVVIPPEAAPVPLGSMVPEQIRHPDGPLSCHVLQKRTLPRVLLQVPGQPADAVASPVAPAAMRVRSARRASERRAESGCGVATVSAITVGRWMRQPIAVSAAAR